MRAETFFIFLLIHCHIAWFPVDSISPPWACESFSRTLRREPSQEDSFKGDLVVLICMHVGQALTDELSCSKFSGELWYLWLSLCEWSAAVSEYFSCTLSSAWHSIMFSRLANGRKDLTITLKVFSTTLKPFYVEITFKHLSLSSLLMILWKSGAFYEVEKLLKSFELLTTKTFNLFSVRRSVAVGSENLLHDRIALSFDSSLEPRECPLKH